MRFRTGAASIRLALAAAVGLVLSVMVAVHPATDSRASLNTVQVSTTPALFPAFNTAISDYVVRCTGSTPVQVSISNSDPSDTTTIVSVDGGAAHSGAFNAQVSLNLGQAFKIRATQGATSMDYHIRCLPNGFPTWTTQRPGTPQAEYYVIAPSPSTATGQANRYVSIFDTNGVPIWWTLPPSPYRPVDAKYLPNGNILWTDSDNSSAIRGHNAEEVRLDGSAVDATIAPIGYQLDAHEVQHLANGNYLVIGSYSKCCYNLTGYGGPASASIRDDIIQEVTPGGSVLWTWKTTDHIGLDELQSQWASTFVAAGSPYDVFHLNSAVTDSDGDILISFRHLNSIYKITNPASQTNPGKVIWKLGGSVPTMEPGTRLTISGDPVFASGGGFGGQHYPRYFDSGDGNLYVTLHDNGSSLNRAPRGVRYQINEGAKTATMVEQVNDTAAPNMRSSCCGSAGKLPGGNWVMSWGNTSIVAELTPAGSRAFVLTTSAPSYRADPILPGAVTREALRSGMDTQYPRSSGSPTPTPTSSPTPTPTPSPTPTLTPTPTRTPTPTPTPTRTPTPTPTPSPTPTPTATPSPSPSPTPTPSPNPADPDGDGVLDAADNCPSVSNPDQANQDGDEYGDACEQPSCVTVVNHWVVPDGDSDCDGYPDATPGAPLPVRGPESIIGTLASAKCSATMTTNDEPLPDAWPPDFNDNQLVNGSDFIMMNPLFGSNEAGGSPYDRRHDLSGDGVINGQDFLQMNPFFGKHCSP